MRIVRPSIVSSRPASPSPIPASSLIVSSACSEPDDSDDRRKYSDDRLLYRLFRIKRTVRSGSRRVEDRNLSADLLGSTVYHRYPPGRTEIVDRITGGVVVGAVHDDVAIRQDFVRIAAVEPVGADFDPAGRIQPRQPCRGDFRFRSVQVGGRVENLALQVAQRYGVVFDDPQAADSRRRQVVQRRRAESSGSDHRYATFREPLLPGCRKPFDQQVALIAFRFSFGHAGLFLFFVIEEPFDLVGRRFFEFVFLFDDGRYFREAVYFRVDVSE